LITSIIFSKNRPLQLDLCLKSIKKNFTQSTKNIVICNNDEEFDDAYHTLKNEHSDVMFWNQSDSLFHDINRMVRAAFNDYVCFFVDDCICFNKVDLSEDIFDIPEVCCLSLRLGANISQRHHNNVAYPDEPSNYGVDSTGRYMVWNKTAHCYGSYWSYSHSVDGHIFKRSEMDKITSELWELSEFKDWKQTPNEFESAIQRFWALSPSLMICPLESAVVNSPNNKVQESHDNRSGDYFDYSEKTLLEKYESGSRIKLEDLDFSDVKCPHTEIDILKGLK
tara:strand:+ start:3144 stop:3983 length:840 start_codon:yes stop_codon:yes gene_type:complete